MTISPISTLKSFISNKIGVSLNSNLKSNNWFLNTIIESLIPPILSFGIEIVTSGPLVSTLKESVKLIFWFPERSWNEFSTISIEA